MTIVTETYKAYGKLISKDFGTFILLKSLPNVHSVPIPLRDAGYLEWFVLDESTGEGKNILLKDDCMIEPYYEAIEMEVKLTIDDDAE